MAQKHIEEAGVNIKRSTCVVSLKCAGSTRLDTSGLRKKDTYACPFFVRREKMHRALPHVGILDFDKQHIHRKMQLSVFHD
jgi:hypothetical protein